MQYTAADKKALGALAAALQEISIIEARMQTLTERERVEELKQERAEERARMTRQRVKGREQRTDVMRLRQEVAKLKKREMADRDALREETDVEKRKDLRHDLATTHRRLEDFEERLAKAERTAIVLDEELPKFSADDLAAAHVEQEAEARNASGGSTPGIGTRGIGIGAAGMGPSGVGAHDSEIEEASRALERAENALQADLDAAEARAQQARGEMAPEVLEIFEREYDEHGVGAAWLKGRTCQGCFMELDPMTMRELRQAPADEIQHCPECNVIILLPED